MSEQEFDFEVFFGITKQKSMSQFLANELIFEFINNQMDEKRSSEMAKIIEKNPDISRECNNMRGAQNYCAQLGQLVPMDQLIQRLSGTRGWNDRFKALLPARWPIPLKWGIEALVASCIVAAAALTVFWSDIEAFFPHAPQATLLEEKIRLERETNTPITDKNEIAEFQKNVTPNAPVELPQMEVPSEPVKAAPVPLAEKKIVATQAPLNPQPSSAPKKKGYLYKMYMKLDNLDVIGPEIAAKIEELDGIKAGEVELGWRKPNGAYYHFVIPKDNYGALQEVLKSYGPLTTAKEPHDRVMPEGQERYILWIEGN